MAPPGDGGPGGEDLMAFEAFRAQSEPEARRGRKRLWYALSIAFHGALIGVGIAYSFWHIEELSPPLLKVTFMSAAPPPPPAPPPPAGGGAGAAKKKVTVKPKPLVQAKPELVQPREIPKPVDPPRETPAPETKSDDKGEKAGTPGGTIGGTPGGTVGGTPGGTIGGTPGGTAGGTPGAPKFLPPHIGIAQKLSGDDPPFPPALRQPGAVYHVLVKVCVTVTGAVDKVTIMKSTESQLDVGVIETLKRSWRFRPYMANAMAIPFCTIKDFEFKTQS
jgi:outer membrane biosynthesis protein TonB